MTESQSGIPDDPFFLTLIADLVTQAWMALGKIKRPASDKVERNILAAGTIIDMLDMLNRKTAGNRSLQEDRLLMDSINQLKLNYVAEKDLPDEGERQAPAEDAAPPAQDAEPAGERKPSTRNRKKKKPAGKGKKPASTKSRAKK